MPSGRNAEVRTAGRRPKMNQATSENPSVADERHAVHTNPAQKRRVGAARRRQALARRNRQQGHPTSRRATDQQQRFGEQLPREPARPAPRLMRIAISRPRDRSSRQQQVCDVPQAIRSRPTTAAASAFNAGRMFPASSSCNGTTSAPRPRLSFG